MYTIPQMDGKVLDDFVRHCSVQLSRAIVASNPGQVLVLDTSWSSAADSGRLLALGDTSSLDVDHIRSHEGHEVVIRMLGAQSLDGFIEPGRRGGL